MSIDHNPDAQILSMNILLEIYGNSDLITAALLVMWVLFDCV